MTGSLKTDYDKIIKILNTEEHSVFFNEPLSRHSSWKIGGPADILIEPSTQSCIEKIYSFAKQENYPFIVIGKGSNILFDDAGFRGIVMKLGKSFSRISIEKNIIVAESGLFIPKMAIRAAENGLSGLEHVCGIPGTLGGLIFMNGGSMNKSIGENVVSVETIDPNGNIKIFSKDTCDFSYRKSTFQNSSYLITRVTLACNDDDPLKIKKRMEEIHQKRKNNFPLNYPNCGSVFKTDFELKDAFGPPGKIIDDAGLKGLRIGDAEVSSKHANFIINRGNAASSDVISLIKDLRDHVYRLTNRHLKCEVQYLEPEGRIRHLHEIL